MSEKIILIRSRFEEELKKNSSLYDPVDIKRVRTEDWQIQRYLLDSNNEIDSAYQNLLRTLAWKKSFGLHQFKLSDFSSEIYDIYCFEIYSKDKFNRIILSESYKRQKYFSELDQLVRNIIAYQIEKADRLAFENGPENGVIYLGDFTDTPVLHLNVPLAKFRVDVINQHYPLMCQKIGLINVPFLLKPVIKLIVSFLKPSIKNAVENYTYETLKEQISDEVLHEDMKGNRKKREIPEGTGTLKNLIGKVGITEEAVKQFYKFHQLE
ncbi:hypothetical protein TYRP_000196 [Tyrophagus putrescentiae]|nr:hypothetical protein TYRP_000196 [Tyrophagus putrescentiae]